MAFTQTDLLNAMEKEPALTDFGIGIYEQRTIIPKEERERKLLEGREELRNNLDQFQTCCEWLMLCHKRKTINLNIGTSYGLKHRVEKYFSKYVTNGAFIAAIIHLEIPYKIYPNNPNITVALSSKLPPEVRPNNHV